MQSGELLNVILSVAFLATILQVTTPILLAALGGLIADLAGTINVALDGSMLVAALTGVVVSAYTQSAWLGVLAALVASTLFCLLLAVVHLELGADVIIAGVALNILASSGTAFALYALTGDRGSSARLASLTLPSLQLPLLETIPVLGRLVSGQNVLVYGAYLLTAVVWLLLYRTVLGLRLRAVGSSALSAASAGVDTRRARYIALGLSGALSGLGGIYLSMGYLQLFQRDMTAGRGFIALAAVLLGGRRPLGTLAAALAFGTADALASQLGSLAIPPQIVQMIPYAATVVIMIVYGVAGRHARYDRPPPKVQA